MYDLWPPGSLCAGRGGAGPSLRAGRKAAGRAQFAVQHCARDRRGAHNGGQTDKKSVGGGPALAPLTTEKDPTLGVKGARTR